MEASRPLGAARTLSTQLHPGIIMYGRGGEKARGVFDQEAGALVEQPDSAEPSSQTDRPAGVGPRLAVAVGAAALVGMAAFFAGRWLHRKPAGPTASVTLLSQPTGASAHMDRKFVGVTPVTCKDVPYGEHKLLLKKDGYGPRPLRILI